MATTITRNSADQTVLIFDNFYNVKLVVNSSEYDVVYSYFVSTSENVRIAENFAALIFRIAQESGVNSLELLETIKGQDNKLKMNSVISYYLNSFRSKTSLYGTGITPRPNETVQRNVVL